MRYPCQFICLIVVLTVGLTTGCASQKGSTEKGAPYLAPSTEQAQGEGLDEAISKTLDEDDEWLENDLAEWDEEEKDLDDGLYTVADPIEPFNRIMFTFNDKLYTWLLRPISLGYRKITPTPVRTGVQNFFHNLAAPIRFVNCLLQGKGQAATAEFASFTLNTIYGVLGFGSITKDFPELNPDPEDLGQTLGTYGIGDGFYIVWPFIGSSTLRDTAGRLGDAPLNPRNYIQPTEASLAVWSYESVNKISFRIEDIDDAKKAAFDPYQAYRNFYIQSRQTRIKR